MTYRIPYDFTAASFLLQIYLFPCLNSHADFYFIKEKKNEAVYLGKVDA